jgi:hypothetical protein
MNFPNLTINVSTALLNLGAALTAVFFLAWGLGQLARRYPAGHDYRFLFRALATWWLSWLTWIVLWTYLTCTYLANPNATTSITIVTLLGDINTVLALLTYVFLTRGREFDTLHAVIIGVQALIVVGFIDLGFWGFGHMLKSSAAVDDLQARWSLALAVIGPLIFGWACSLRFGVSWPFVVGVIYSALQPFAYHALLLPRGTGQDQLVIATLAILALLKIAYATSGFACFGMTPRNAENLVRPLARQPDVEPSWNPAWAFVLALGGCCIVWGLAKLSHLDAVEKVGMYLAGFVTSLGGLLEGVDRIGSFIKKRMFGDKYLGIRVGRTAA